MAPTLREGDWLLVDPDAYAQAPPSGADLVLAEAAEGPIVKRVGGVLAGGRLLLAGDAPSTGLHDHTATVPAAAVTGRAWFRYWPPGRIGRVR